VFPFSRCHAGGPPPHALPMHVVPPVHCAHAPPPFPHAFPSVPGWHVPLAQHPLHDVGSHAHRSLAQCSPAGQLPLAQTPPHPSSPPHVFPMHVGAHPHTPVCPPPPHLSGAAH
jgi:hypothetical protein